ncbi:zinc finger FYVE domain-containing protein 26-like isoform X2 [Ptychodera flava]|uniref:zinc finger FYVE domain-containing protein 26-like isoform X2 n=1 Tax=Ptychodera flava TaxID=63121 RepID=UPI00396A7D09
MSHPFGNEAVVSTEQCFLFFCNNLSLGQWELASSCVTQLTEQTKGLRLTNVKDILKTVIECPYACSYGSFSLLSPNHLSWLCLQEYERIGTTKDVLPKLIHKDVEFRLLLFCLCHEDITSEALKGLYNYHNHVLACEDGSSKSVGDIPSLTAASLVVLKKTLQRDPVLAHTIINYLTKKNVDHLENNTALQQLYVDSITEDLAALKSQCDSKDTSSTEVNVTSNHLCQTLMLFDPTQDMNSLQIQRLFWEISTLIQNHQIIEEQDIYSALLGRDTSFLMQQYCLVQNEFRSDLLKTSGRPSVKEDVRVNLQLSQCENRTNAWKDMFHMCVKSESHMLESTVETALELIKEGLFDDLKSLLEPSDFKPLKPLVLLFGWNYCFNCVTATQLLDALWVNQDIKTQPLFEQACNKLAYQVQLVQWCLQKAQPLSTANEMSNTLHQRASHMFHGLESHSVLYVLHQSLYLADLDQKLVLDILSERPVLPAVHDVKGSEENKEKKSVRFAPMQDNNKTRQLSIEQERDTMIYRSFCSLKLIMDVIHLCKQDFTKTCTHGRNDVFHDQPEARDDPSLCVDVSSRQDESQESNAPTQLYNEEVNKRLDSVKQHLSQLYPLTYRVETLENIFSLLFIKHSDIRDNSPIHSESGSEREEDHIDVYPRQVRSSGEIVDCPMTPVLERSMEINSDAVESSELPDVTVSAHLHPSTNDDFIKKTPVVMPTIHTDSGTDKLKSDNASGRSSLTWEIKTGYISNSQVTGDVLRMLKECLIELSTAKYVQKGQSSTESSARDGQTENQSDLTNYIRSSVSTNTFQQRLAKLSQYINEAQWRYQLVSQTSMQQQQQQQQQETKLIEDIYDSYTDDDDLSYYGDSDGEDRLSKRRRRRMSGDLKGRSSSDASVSSRDRRRRKKRRHRRRGSRRSLQKSNSGIISRMLSSPETLLRMSLRKTNFTQATQVTKLLKIEDESEVVEVSFAQHLDIAMKKIEILEPKKPTTSEKVVNRTSLVRSNLSAIANVAASGMASSSVTSIVDELLSTSQLPVITTKENRRSCDALLERFATNQEVPALVILDLACTSSNNWDVCKDLLQMSTDKLQMMGSKSLQGGQIPGIGKQDTNSANVRKESKILKGPMVIMQQLCDLIAQSTHDTSTTIRSSLLQKFYRRSILDVMTTGTLPVYAESLKTHLNSAIEQDRAMQKLETILMDYCGPGDDVVTGNTDDPNGVERLKKSSVITAGQSVNRTLVRQTMKQLIQIYGRNKTMAFVRILRDQDSGRNDSNKADYLTSLYHHVDVLASLLMDSANVIAGSAGVKSPNPFRVLNGGLTSTLGKMIFEQHIPPTRLENVASQLKLNLVHIVVQICAPSIPIQQLTQPSLSEDLDLDPCGRLVLNRTGNINDRRNPEIIASELLNRMLNLMRVHSQHAGADGIFDMTSAIHAVKSEEYKDIVNATHALVNVDLKQLQNRNEKICFYTNVFNMMIIHASLFHIQRYTQNNQQESFVPHHSRHSSISKGTEMDLNLTQSQELPLPYHTSSSTLDRLTYMSKISYQIGQLGTVSALDLRFVFLRNGLPPPSTFDNILRSRIHILEESDPWNSYIPPLDARLLFVINSGTVSSPTVKVLKPRQLQEQLSQSMSAYMNVNVSVNLDKQQVCIPELLYWYCGDFVTMGETDNIDSNLLNEGLLNFISPYTSTELRSKLDALMFSSTAEQINYEISPKVARRSLFSGLQQEEEPIRPATFQIKIEPYNYKYGYLLDDNASDDVVSSSIRRRRHSSLPRNITPVEIGKPSVMPLYKMTDAMMTYLKRKSTFVASLVSLLSSKTESFKQASTSSESKERENGMGIEKRNEETMLDKMLMMVEKYPVIQRYIKTYMATLITVSDEMKVGPSCNPFSEMWKKDIGRCVLSGLEANELKTLMSHTMNQLLCTKRWTDAVELLQSVCHQESNLTEQTVLKDFILCCAGTGTSAEQNDNWKYLLRLTDRDLYAHTVLACLKSWPVDVCVHLLEQGLAYPPTNKSLSDAVQKKVKEMRVYQKVLECTSKINLDDAFELTLTLRDEPQTSTRTKWCFVAMEMKNNPDRVMDVLISCQEFNVARQWAQSHRVPDSLKQTIEEKFLIHILSDHNNIMKAYQILEEISDDKQCQNVCEAALPSLNENFQSTVFLSQYMLTQLKSQFSIQQLEEIQSVNLGAKALLCLPESTQQDYKDLISKPQLILEQLFMNMKVELAEKVIETLKKEIRNPNGVTVDRCSVDVLDELVLSYAAKALEFPVVQQQQEDFSDLESTLMQSMASTPQSSILSTLEQSISIQSLFTSSIAVTTPVTSIKPITSSGVSTASNITTFSTPKVIRKAPDGRGRSPPLSYVKSVGSADGKVSPSGSLSKRSSLNASPIGSVSKRSSVQIPSEMTGDRRVKDLPLVPPSQNDWVPDSAASHCMVCKVERFSMFNRRHHCRRCGRVVCASCSERTSIVRGYGDIPVRICDDCYDQFITKKSSYGVSPEVLEQKLQERLSGTFFSNRSPKILTPNLSSHGTGSGATPIAATEIPELMEPDDWYAELKPRQQWKLTSDDIYNDTIRDDFYYEQAPSTSLCMSILDLHSQPLKCAKQILELCRDVSAYLKPIRPGIPNPEVDYNLVISMIQTLLLNAKVRYMKCGESSGVALCDTYLSRVDILTLMLSANYKNIPTIEELIKSDSARRIRDKLLQEERLDLAMEVSTKCGLDSTAVWSAWGTAHLKAAEYQQAREKFSRCLKTPSDRNQQQKPSPLLVEIISFLEGAPRSDMPLAESLLAPLKSMKELISDPAKGMLINRKLDAAQLEECLYYLKSYGSHLSIVEFYKKHNFLPKAVQYIVEQQCSTEIFIEGLLLPSIKGGDLSQLQEQMLIYDPSLEKWNNYLNASCRYLIKKSYNHVLYHFQIFMKDYIRAAMTCIKFFQSGATSYAELFDRLNHLNNAKTHMKEVLDEKKWGMVQRPAMLGGSKTAAEVAGGLTKTEQTTGMRLVLSPSELSKHINTITLQIEVTKYLHRCLTSKAGINQLLSPKKQLPTLFGNSKIKAEVVSMILLSSSSISEGFQLAFKIIQDFRLPAISVYSHTSKQLAQRHKYKEIRQLHQCIKETGLSDDQMCDAVISSSISVIVDESSETKEVDNFIKLLKSDTSKINAYILCGKLKSAYLIAVQGERVDDVRRISSAAQKMGQGAVRNICDRWLQSQEQKRQQELEQQQLLLRASKQKP